MLPDEQPRPSAEEMRSVNIGVIGMGDMGRLYAAKFVEAGWKNVNVCDRPENYERMKEELAGSGMNVLPTGHLVSRISDVIFYSVEAAAMDAIVKEYGPATKVGAIVSGQTSVKAPEQEAFEAHLPPDVHIISCHSLHGPTVDPAGQALLLIQHRAPDEKMELMRRLMSCFRSRFIEMSYREHDLVTANTQACTHAAFLSMGTAWKCSESYPWETGLYPRGIETAKITIMLRIYSAKWHVYAGLALLNPAARTQIQQFADSTTSLFKLMVQEREADLRARVFAARRGVFGWRDDEDGEGGAGFAGAAADHDDDDATAGAKRRRTVKVKRKPILMSDRVLDKFQLAARAAAAAHESAGSVGGERTPRQNGHHPGSVGGSNGATSQSAAAAAAAAPPPPNSHLSLLAIVDCWHQLGIDPWQHLEVAATPIFRAWIGVCEWLFRSPARLEASVRAAATQREFRSDDTEFVLAARGWAQAVRFGSFELFRYRFEETREFFQDRFGEGLHLGAEMLKLLGRSSTAPEDQVEGGGGGDGGGGGGDGGDGGHTANGAGP